jgi:hypothetical protein
VSRGGFKAKKMEEYMIPFNRFPERKMGPLLCDLQGDLYVKILKDKKSVYRKIYVMNSNDREIDRVDKVIFQYRSYSKQGVLSGEIKEVSYKKLLRFLDLEMKRKTMIFENKKTKKSLLS